MKTSAKLFSSSRSIWPPSVLSPSLFSHRSSSALTLGAEGAGSATECRGGRRDPATERRRARHARGAAARDRARPDRWAGTAPDRCSPARPGWRGAGAAAASSGRARPGSPEAACGPRRRDAPGMTPPGGGAPPPPGRRCGREATVRSRSFSLSGQLIEEIVEAVEHRCGGGQLLLAELLEGRAPERLVAGAARVHQRLAVLGERGEHHTLVALGALALHEAGGLERLEHLRDRCRRHVRRQSQLAGRHLAAERQPEQQAVLRVAQLARLLRLAALQPPHRGGHRPERLAELVEHMGAVLGLDGGHAATASAIVSASATACAPFSSRALRSARMRITQGMIARALSPADHRKAVPYASAAALRVCAPAIARWSTTARTAVPIEPPTRCSTLSCGVACASSERSRA